MAQLSAVALGIVVCTLGGLLAMTGDLERPARFVPVYLLAMIMFFAGLALMVWSLEAGEYLRAQLESGSPAA